MYTSPAATGAEGTPVVPPHGLAEPRRELIVANTADGPASARGRVGGRVPKLTVDRAALAQRLHDERERTVRRIVDVPGVPRSTVYGHLDKTRTVPRRPKRTAATKP